MEAFDANGQWGALIFERFFHWYAPFFNAYSFVLARSNEYVAECCSAEVAGAQMSAAALIATEVKGSYLARMVWPGVYERVNMEFPGETFVVALTGDYGCLKKVMKKMEGTQIYTA